jgi:DNA repair photolyase
MKLQEIRAKSILSPSRIYDYTINAYVGCSHACRYCYAAFMKRFTGHRERWGEFVDVKLNAPELLARQIARRPRGRVWVSGVCDPYQAEERQYGLTGRCLEILVENGWPVTVQTKSSLVLRDSGILEKSPEAEVGFTITTADEEIRQLFEPGASPIRERIQALGILHAKGIKTFAMIAPVLPGAAELVPLLAGKVDHVLVDRLNYHYADRLYREKGIGWAMEEPFFLHTADELKRGFDGLGIPVQVLY